MKYLVVLFVFFGINTFPQNTLSFKKVNLVDDLLDSLWVNPTSFFNKDDTNWRLLCSNLQHIDKDKLNQIISSIYTGSEAMIENESSASEGFIGSLNKSSHDKRLKKFNKKTKNDFTNKDRYPNHKIVLVEGDSWFEYPLFLQDITVNLMKQDNLAVYSIASGGDWAANMVARGEYQDEYMVFKPDVFIMGGDGNDLLENERLTTLV